MRHNQSAGGAAGWNVAWSRRFGMDGRTPAQWDFESASHFAGDWANPPNNRLTHVQERSAGVATPPTVPQSHFYDANGNMIGEHNERHFEWDYADRMKVFRNQIDGARPSVYALYLYDAAGQRVKKLVVTGNGYRTTNYLGMSFEHHSEYGKLDGERSAENCSLHVMDGKNRIAMRRLGLAFADDGTAEHAALYHLGDHLGSSGLVFSDKGKWINREEFFPYGETSFGSFRRKRYRFTGMERDDESGLNYHSRRTFAPHLMRWLTPDPIGSTGGINLFTAFGENPLNRVDPTGTCDTHGTPSQAGAAAESTKTPSNIAPQAQEGGGFSSGPVDSKNEIQAQIDQEYNEKIEAIRGQQRDWDNRFKSEYEKENKVFHYPSGVADDPALRIALERLGPRPMTPSESNAANALEIAFLALLVFLHIRTTTSVAVAAEEIEAAESTVKQPYIPRDKTGRPIPLDRAPEARGDTPLPDPDASGRAHTTLGGKTSERTGDTYRQSATFPEHQPDVPEYAKPQYEVDWTNHRYADHPDPHMHEWSKDFEPQSQPWRKGPPLAFPPWHW